MPSPSGPNKARPEANHAFSWENRSKKWLSVQFLTIRDVPPIGNACNRVNCQGGFAPQYGGGLGRFIPALSALLTLAQGDDVAQEIAKQGQDYYDNLKKGEDVTIEAAILRNCLNNLAPLSGEVAFPTLLK